MSYELSNLKNNFICGDSLIELDKLNENDINLVFTSPPYYNARPEYSFYSSYEEYLGFIEQIIKKIYKILQEGRFFVINVSPVIVPREKRSSSSKRFAIPFDIHGLFIKNGFEFIDDIIWQKPSGAGCGRGRRFYCDRSPLQYKTIPITEYVLVYRKKSNKLIDWFIKNHPDQKLVEDSKVEDGYETTNIWKINPSSNKVHPAIFPIELAEKVIKYYSFKNDVILDPFGGIGTTAIAAEKLERRYYLIEKEIKYVEEFYKNKNI